MNLASGGAWDALLNYETHDLVRRRFEAVHQRGVNAQQTKEITSAFRQARSYFQSASAADRAVKPLLLYYGVVGLARSAILFLDWRKRDATLAPKHGLSEDGWQNLFGRDAPELSCLAVKAEKAGTLPEFAAATRNVSLCRMGVSEVNFPYLSPAAASPAWSGPATARHDGWQSRWRIAGC